MALGDDLRTHASNAQQLQRLHAYECAEHNSCENRSTHYQGSNCGESYR